MYELPLLATLVRRPKEPRRFLQVLTGPRQVGKTTLANQALEQFGLPSHFASADELGLRDQGWVATQWDAGRLRAADGGRRGGPLVLDEIPKVSGWSETVKRLWDEDSAAGMPLRVLLLGSSPLLMQQRLTGSLAGRFEMIRMTHWSFAEMRDAFGWDVERYLYFGGYPGSAPLVRDRERWARYVTDSLVETTVSRDTLLMARVNKPALLRHMFALSCDYSGLVLSFQKMLGQPQDAGNTVTLAHYLDLLAGAGLVASLQKYSGSEVRRRGSSPKLVVMNNALITAQSHVLPAAARRDPALWGRLVESAVGAHVLRQAPGAVGYWRERDREVDFVVEGDKELLGIEVTSGRRKDQLPGLDMFARRFGARRLRVGGQGVPLEEFLAGSLAGR